MTEKEQNATPNIGEPGYLISHDTNQHYEAVSNSSYRGAQNRTLPNANCQFCWLSTSGLYNCENHNSNPSF